MYKSQYRQKRKTSSFVSRLRITTGILILVALLVIGRLFILMVLHHDFYIALAKGSHEIYSKLMPERGNIYVQSKGAGRYPVAINRDYFLIYANPSKIKTDKQITEVLSKLNDVFSFNKKKKEEIKQKLAKQTDPYEPIKEKVTKRKADKIKKMDLPGIKSLRKSYRYYPEGKFAGPTIGFVGKNEEGKKVGRYGIEGYWNNELNGKRGFLEGVKSASGSVLPTLATETKKPKDGVDITLTLDRAIQFKACKKLRKKMDKYNAESASLVVIRPDTGKIAALCSLPDFNPNKYNKVSSLDYFNNSAIYTPYEIGSVFKPIVMSAAIEEGVVEPETTFKDTGKQKGICSKPIKNSRGKEYGLVEMIEVLEESINTGMVYVAKKLGKRDMIEYIEKYGFGTKTGIKISQEASGTIDSLYENEGDKIDCYAATASFGQGITATPLQMVTAYSAIANGGKLMRPLIIKSIEYPSGRVEKYRPRKIRKVISEETSSLIKSMLVNVVDQGHANTAAVEGYYVAGKTGTAQISAKGGYSKDTNHTFIGFAPMDNPEFVLAVKFHKPDRRFSASTAAPTFGEIAKFLLDYYQIAPSRS